MSILAAARAAATVPTRNLAAAREFYEGALGLEPAGSLSSDVDILYEAGRGTRVLLYEWSGTVVPSHTVVHFETADVESAVRELRERGVAFDEMGLPELETVDGIATVNGRRFAWFKDPDSNVLAIHD
jgi:catechol 2,3-dioxygenase-like lactoylglutathione lyase family enzyme